MKSKTLIVRVPRSVWSWCSCQLLLVALAIVCWSPSAHATSTWAGIATGATNAWSNPTNWVGNVAPAFGDSLVFGDSTNKVPNNNINSNRINGITFTTNGYVVSGIALTNIGGISDSVGSNTVSIAQTIGVAQTFQNTAGGASNSQTTVSGAIALTTNNLTIGGSGSFFITGAITSTNGGTLTVNNSAGVVRLGVVNAFGTNTVQITNFIASPTYTTNTTIYSNAYVVVGTSTNYFPFTNTVVITNGTLTYVTNVLGPLNAYAVTVGGGGILQLNNAGAVPGGASVGSVLLNGSLDLNGLNPTINGLDGAASGRVGNYNYVTGASNGVYTLTVGTGNSNGVLSGIIENGAQGTVGLTKNGWGRQDLDNANTYSGSTIINQGILRTTINGSLGSHSQVLTIGSGAVFDVSPWNPDGYEPTGPLNLTAGTPTKPYTNYLGSFDPFSLNGFTVTLGTNNIITLSTNTDLATFTNVVSTTNFVSLVHTTNSIISIINADVIGNMNLDYAGAQISPSTAISPGIATWTIDGNLNIETVQSAGVNRANFLLNTNTAAGGGTNDLIYVNGTLNIGNELDVVVTPLYGSLASGTYTLFYAGGGYTAFGNGGAPADLVFFAARGITGSFSSDANHVYLTASGTANPGTVKWAATSLANNNWDVHLTQNWKSNNVADYFYSQDSAVFDDSGFGTVNLPAVVNISSVTFNNNATNYTFVQNAAEFLTGTGGVTKNGSGTVTLQNPNSFTGDTTVNGGTLALGFYNTGTFVNNHALYNGVPAGNLDLGGGVITMNGANNTLDEADFINLYVNAGASVIRQEARGASGFPVYEFSNNVVRAVGGVVDFASIQGKAGSKGGVFFENTNINVNGILGGWATFGLNDWVLATNTLTANPGNGQEGTCQYVFYQVDNNPANWGSTSNVLVGGLAPVTISVGSSATINSLRTTNAARVTVNIAGGQTLTLSSGGILVPAAGSFQSAINGGTLKGAAGADLVVLNQNNTVASGFTIGSVIADNGGASGLTTAGQGTTILTGNNTYTGPTYIDNAFVGSLPGTLQVGANGTSGSIANSSAVIDNGVLAFNRSDDTSVSGVISGSGSLIKLSAGTLTLTANSTVSGQVTISAGTLQLGNGGAAGSVSNASAIVDNGRLVFDNNNTVSYPKPISGFGSLVQFGSGNLIIAANETYSGGTIVSNGTMTLTSTGYLTNTASIRVNAGATLDVSAVSGGLALRSATSEILSGGGTVSGSVTTANGTTLSPGSSIGTLTINNNLTLGGGTFNFEVNNASNDLVNVGGTLTENSGTMTITVVGGALGNGVYKLIHATGGITGSAANLGLFGFNQPGQIAVLTNEASGDLSLLVYSGTITSLSWAGSAYGGASDAWNLSALNWSNAPGALVAFANPDYALFDEVISYTNPVDIQVAVSPTTVTVNATNFNFTLGNGTSASKITGGASLVKNGSGQLTLQTTNDYLGGTIINAGTVQLGNNTSQGADGMVGNGTVLIGAGASLVASNFAPETISGSISGSGLLVQAGVGKLTLTADNSSFSGAISSSGALQMGNGVSGTLGSANVTNNRALLFNVGPTPASTVAVNGNISGTGSITNLGPGIVQLNGNNTYTSNTVVNIGTLQLGSDFALPKATTLIMNDSSNGAPVGILDLNGHSINIGGLAGDASGNGLPSGSLNECQIVNNGSGTATITISGGGTTTFNGQILDNNNSGSGKVALLVTNDSTLTINAIQNNASTPINPFPNLFSGGIIVSNATVFLGQNNNTGTAGNVGTASAGLGTITLLGGGQAGPTNGVTGTITNGTVWAAAATGSGNPTLNTTIAELNVPVGANGTFVGPQRGTVTMKLTGGGNLTYLTEYVRSRLAGDLSGFTGTFILGCCTIGPQNQGGQLGIDGTLGLPQASVIIRTNNLQTIQLTGTSGGNVFRIGSLAGGDNTTQIGGGTINGGNGTANTIWEIGGLGTSTTNGSQFVDAGCGIRKVGGGILALTNNVLSFGGQCVVSNGTLVLIPLGNNPGAFNALTNNFLVGTNFTIVSPGILDVSAMGNTLYLGHSANNQTLFGNGTINGNLQTMGNTNTLIAPASRASSTNVFPGNLNVTGNISINTNCTLQMVINRTNSPAYDSLTAGGSLTISRASLIVVTNGDIAYTPGSSNVFRFFNVAVTVGVSSGITNITLPAITNCYWVTNLTLDGSMALVNTNSPVVPLVFTNTPGITNFSLAGLNVHLSGTNGQSGVPYYLRVSTNAALSFTNWTTVATNTFATAGGFTFIGTNVIDTNAPQQFYILSNTNK